MRILILAGLAGFLASAASASGLPPAYDDAPLHAVHFVDAKEGWAVGDQGVVWHTPDGGKNWERQITGTQASLRSVHFLTPYCGWIAGRTMLPNDAGSSGIVLFTEDCGATWKELSSGDLPGLNFIKFFSETSGIACGDGSDLVSSGAFVTHDGGKSWTALRGPRATSWTGADFTALNYGVLGGVWSKVSTLRDGKIAASELDSLNGRAINGISLKGTSAVAACSGGVVLLSDNGGTKWSVANLGLPAEVLECLDFRTVARSGASIWIAGRPGSVVLRSQDAGKTWALCKTGWALPIRSLCAASETELFAVGDLGMILKSSDAGTTWKPQKCGAHHAAILFAQADGRTVPMDAIARLSACNGYVATALSLTTADSASAPVTRCLDPFRLSMATRSAGGAAADSGWAFPVANHLNEGSPKDLLAAWNKLGANAEERLVKQLVLAYRIWKPEVIVSDAILSTATPAEQLVLIAARKAFKLCDDPKAYPEQLDALGLQVHSPKKLYAIGDEAGAGCAVKYDQTAFEKRLLDAPQQFAEASFALAGSGWMSPKQRCFRLISHRLPGSETHADLMQGIHLGEGGTARRKLPIFGDGLEPILAEREKAVKSRQRLEGIALGATTAIAAEKTLVQIAVSLKTMPDDIACRTGVSLGRQLAASGKWVAAREMFLLVVNRYSAFPEAVDAVRWLSKYYASTEARHWAESENNVTYTTGSVTPNTGGLKPATHVDVNIDKQTFRMTDTETAKSHWKACLELETKLAGFGPVYNRDPAILLATLAARRQLGLTGDAAKQMAAYFQNVPGASELPPGVDLWRDCLASEVWLFNKAAITVQPKPLAICPTAPKKPYLDGKLDDECWGAFKPLDMKNATSAADLKGYSTKTYFAHDEQFVYVAVECKHPEGKHVPKAEKRLRDDNLAGHDRVDILFDLDRDYQTYFRFQVDQRGCVAEDCWGEKGWNPKWHVALDSTPTGWTAEIAIPRGELSAGPIAHGATWGMNVSRVVPGAGVQSWSGPADANPRPEGMGLMKFQVDAVK